MNITTTGDDSNRLGDKYLSKLIERLLEIDKQLYNPSLRGTLQNACNRCTNSNTLITAWRDDVIVGYAIILSLGEEMYRKIAYLHEYHDDDILGCEMSEDMNRLMILSIAVLPSYQDTDVIEEIANKIGELCNRSRIKSLIACVVSEAGAKFARNFGMTETFKSSDKSYSIYEAKHNFDWPVD